MTFRDTIVDRGCIHKSTPAGVEVYMAYDEPGVFYNEHGAKVSPQLAKEAGFDTVPLLRERKKREAMATATAEIEKQYASTASVREVVLEKGDYRVVHVGNQQHFVEHVDGDRMNKQALSKDMALKTLEAMVKEDDGE